MDAPDLRLEELLQRADAQGLHCRLCPTDNGCVAASDGPYLMHLEQTLRLFAEALASAHQIRPDVAGPRGEVDPNHDNDTDEFARDGLGARAVAAAVNNKHRQPQRFTPLTAPYSHMTRSDLLDVLNERVDLIASRQDSLVLLQGKPTLANLHMSGPRAIGFGDWSNAGIGDRHFDLAFAFNDILQRSGPAALAVFVEAYGADDVDPVRLDWFSLAIELSK